jgi:phosphohistidine phosphatase SixA
MLRDALTTPGRGSNHVRIHTSTMTRAKETADIVAEQLPPGSYQKLSPSPLLVEGARP